MKKAVFLCDIPKSCGEQLGPGEPGVFFQKDQCAEIGFSGEPLSEVCKAEVTGDASSPYLVNRFGKG